MESTPTRFVLTGATFVALAIPLIRRLVPPNPFYGFRVPSTLRDRELWFQVNRRTGWLLLMAGIGQIIAALVLSPLFRSKPDTYARANRAVTVLGTGAMGGLSYRYLRQLRNR